MEQITIVVPTYNRPSFLKKFIFFLDEFKITCPIIVADGSDDPELMLNRTIIKEHNIIHNNQIIHWIDKSFFIERINNAVKLVKTNYCKINSDDDFFSREFILNSIVKLNNYKNLVAITGYQFSFHNKFKYNFNRPIEVNSENPLERIIRNKSNWHPWSVYRTNILYLILSKSTIFIGKLSKTSELTNWIKIRYFGFYLKLYTSLFGKIKSLRYCENVTVYHENNWGKKHSNFSFDEILLHDSFIIFLKDIFHSIKADFNLSSAKSSALILATLYYDKQVEKNKTIFSRISDKIEFFLKMKFNFIYFIIYDYKFIKKIIKFIQG